MFRASFVMTRRCCRQRLFTSSTKNDTSSNNKINITAGGAALLLVGGAVSGRWILSSHLIADDQSRPRRDASKATVVLHLPKSTDTPKLKRENLDTETRQVVIDAEQFEFFCKQQRRILKAERVSSQQKGRKRLETQLKQAFQGAHDRIPKFADWYFSYATTWKLWGMAISSAANHAISFRTEQSLKDKVSQDLQAFVCQKYEAIVLRPAVTDPLIHRAFREALRGAFDDYQESISNLHNSVADLISDVPVAQPKEVLLELDWTAQLQKVEHVPMAFEKSPKALTVALVGAGAVSGKLAGGAAIGGATKAMLGKLVAPFATKAVGASMSGATAGAVVGGPLGAAAGAAVGIGVDMTVNAGVALMQRSAFETDLKDSLDVTVKEWQDRLFPEMDEVQEIWFATTSKALSAPEV